MSDAPPFSAAVVSSLRRADRDMRATERGDVAQRYSICRSAMASIAVVDSFVIGFFDGEDRFASAYVYDNGLLLQPEVIQLGAHSLSRWIRTSRQTYRYDSDGGMMMRRTIPFGDPTQLSRDAVVVPLISPSDNTVVGVMNVQTLQPHKYDDEVARAAEWVAQALMTANARDESDLADLSLYALYPELDTTQHESEPELLERIARQLSTVYSAVRDFVDLAESEGAGKLSAAAGQVSLACERAQTEIGRMMRGRDQRAASPTAIATTLTARELEIATLIAMDGLTNAQLADRLHISTKTVKAHVGSVLRKLGAAQRSEISWLLGVDITQRS